MQENKDNEILQMMNNTSIYPMLKESEVGISNYTPLPFSRLAAYGTAFQPLTTAVQLSLIHIFPNQFFVFFRARVRKPLR